MPPPFDVGQQLLQHLMSPANLLFLVTAVVLFGLMSYGSLRFLRRLPDFAQKTKMLWGARWLWVLVAGVVGLPHALAYLGVLLTPYDFTFFVGAKSLLWIGLLLILYLLPWQAGGAWLWWSYAFLDRGKLPSDLHEWLRQRTRLARILRVMTTGMVVGLLTMWAITIWANWRVDREMLQSRQMGELATTLQRKLASPDVDRVFTMTPPDFSTYRLLIALTQDAAVARQEEVLAQTKSALHALGRKEPCSIWVGRRHSTERLEGHYEP